MPKNFLAESDFAKAAVAYNETGLQSRRMKAMAEAGAGQEQEHPSQPPFVSLLGGYVF